MGETGVQTLMIAGGGTGGHVYPAIAIAQEYVARNPGRRVVFVGTERGLETQIVPKAGFPLELISVGGIKGISGLALLRNVARLPIGIIQAWLLIGRHRPNAVLGVGGYASGPVLMVASLRGIPTLIHEQNAFPGLTNRLLARLVDAVAVAFPDAAARLRRPDALAAGNPVRKEFFELGAVPRSVSDQRRLLLFGGSQGSRVLNDAMTGALRLLAPLKERLTIVHQTGPRDLERVETAYRASPFKNARVVGYLDPISKEIADGDLVVSRAGAMTIGELAAIGRAAILVPFAAATNNHQEVNARVVERAGGAIVITEAELSPERLADAIRKVIEDRTTLERMSAAAGSLAMPGATKNIVDLIEKIQRN